MSTPNPGRPPEPPLFARRLKELTAGETQAQVATRLGFTASYISQMQRGARPSREFVERLVEAYGLERETWLRLAGIRPQAEEQEDEREDIARRAAAEVLRRTQGPPLERIRAAAEDLRHQEYEPDLSHIRVQPFGGGEISQADLEIVEDIVRALILEERRRRHE